VTRDLGNAKLTHFLAHFLDLGQCEAIALATEVGADVLLIDEQAGRQAALRRRLKVAGTLSMKPIGPGSSFSMT
jgi:predicted nucleic acid-binding protein